MKNPKTARKLFLVLINVTIACFIAGVMLKLSHLPYSTHFILISLVLLVVGVPVFFSGTMKHISIRIRLKHFLTILGISLLIFVAFIICKIYHCNLGFLNESILLVLIPLLFISFFNKAVIFERKPNS